MKKLSVESSDSLFKTIEENKSSRLVLLFTGSKDSAGKSWCPDCNVADPVIEKALAKVDPEDELVFVKVNVGERAVWKDQQNVYRTHKDLKITSVPTLLKWGTAIRLQEAQCADLALVSMIFEEE